MYKVAIIQFPGSNCELETAAAVERAGMQATIWRWNRPVKRLREFHAFILPGGFSYEDRIRAGMVAAHDRVMDTIREAAALGCPVLGICNGAQILVEAGLVPGLSTGSLDAALALNKRVSEHGEVSVGYYNSWVSMRLDSLAERTPFTFRIKQGTSFALPIAHGEGRFLFSENLLESLIARGQVVFRYCDGVGSVHDSFPVNPNGAQYAAAGVSNDQGNVLALMPHPERTPAGQVLFDSLAAYFQHTGQGSFGVLSVGSQIQSQSDGGEASVEVSPSSTEELSRYFQPGGVVGHTRPDDEYYRPHSHGVEFLVRLNITDNTEETLKELMRRRGFGDVSLKRWVHWETHLSADTMQDMTAVGSVVMALIKSDVMLNLQKETPLIRLRGKWYTYAAEGLQEVAFQIGTGYDPDFPEYQQPISHMHHALLVREREQLSGDVARATLRGRLGFKVLERVSRGVVWQLEGVEAEDARRFLVDEHIVANPLSEHLYSYT